MVMSSELNKTLVETVVDDRTLTYEVCKTDFGSLKSNGDVLQFLNSDASDCVNVNSLLFAGYDPLVVDALNLEIFNQQKILAQQDRVRGAEYSFLGAIFFGAASIASAAFSYDAFRNKFDGGLGSRLMGKVYTRTLGTLGALYSLAMVGATGAAAANNYRHIYRSGPNTIELAIADYQVANADQLKGVVVKGSDAFNLFVTAVDRATKVMDKRLRNL